MQNLLSKFSILLGIAFLLIAAFLLYLRQSPSRLTFSKSPTTANSLSYESPNKIEIPSIALNLPIIPALVHGNSWETTTSGVSYLQSTPLPGQKGNSVMYGHNWTSLLGNLPKVKPGQKVYVTMHDGVRREFKVEYTATVNPDQTYIIDNTNDSRLTLYTCTGFLDSKRFVIVAKPA